MSGFGLNASTPRKASEATRQAHGRQLCTLSVLVSEASRNALGRVLIIGLIGALIDSAMRDSGQ